MLEKWVSENASKAIDQNDYQRRYSELVKRYEIQNKIDEISNMEALHRVRHENIKSFIKTLQGTDAVLLAFDEELWNATVEGLKVHNAKEISFIFKDGTELRWEI